MSNRKNWQLRSITRIDEGLHEILFDIDGKPSVKITIDGSLSLEIIRVEGIAAAA